MLVWGILPPKVSDESMGRPYVVLETDDSAIIALDEASWEYWGKVKYYQFLYHPVGEAWQKETPMSTKMVVIPKLSPNEVYEVKVIGFDGNHDKLGESDTVTLITEDDNQE